MRVRRQQKKDQDVDALTMLISLETNLLNNLGKVVTIKSGSEVRGTG